MADWQPIETAPKDGRYVLLCFIDGCSRDPECPNMAVGRYYEDAPDYWLTAIWASSASHEMPTHWMPLPEPPSAS